MGRSSSNRAIVALDRAAVAGLALGLAFYVMPFWPEGRLRPAFWLTFLSTLLHVYTSHARARSSQEGTDTVSAERGPGQGGAA